MKLELYPARDPAVPALWQGLEAAVQPAYFLTWSWIENWLACLPERELPQLAVVRDDTAVIAACFVGRRIIVRHRVVPSRALFVNATGVPALDDLCVEHNGMLVAPGAAFSFSQLGELWPYGWDELFVAAADADLLEREHGRYRVRVDREVAAPYVDLAAVRARGDYLELLSHKTRAQIRRARRELGKLEVDTPHDVAGSLAIYDELVALHTAQWRAKGEPGAFADPWIDHFHRRLIENRAEHGEIQLLRVRDAHGTVGCLYNLIANGRVLVYQSGFAKYDNPHAKPGYVCHAAAIEHAAAAGHATYDPLGGDARYKASLSTHSTRMIWLRIQRRRPQFFVEERLRAWKHASDAVT